MSELIISCRYCGHQWKTKYKYEYLTTRCGKCLSEDLKVTETVDIFGYDSQKPRPDAYVKPKDET